LTFAQQLNGSTAQRLHRSTASPLNGFTAQRLHRSTAQQLNGFPAQRLNGFPLSSFAASPLCGFRFLAPRSGFRF